MSLPLVLALTLIFASSALSLVGLAVAYHLPSFRKHRIHDYEHRKLHGMFLYRAVVLNASLSALLVFLIAWLFGDALFHEGEVSLLEIAWDSAKILLLYDILYYLMHRFAFHEWSLLRGVHTMHHTSKSPTALHSLYTHPVETLLGVGLLLLCTWVVAPVHIYTFAVAFFVYSQLNIVIHAALDIKVFPLNLFGAMARKHDQHHKSMRAGNYASITPLPDWLFRTLQ